jgi:hypothetical protein
MSVIRFESTLHRIGGSTIVMLSSVPARGTLLMSPQREGPVVRRCPARVFARRSDPGLVLFAGSGLPAPC